MERGSFLLGGVVWRVPSSFPACPCPGSAACPSPSPPLPWDDAVVCFHCHRCSCRCSLLLICCSVCRRRRRRRSQHRRRSDRRSRQRASGRLRRQHGVELFLGPAGGETGESGSRNHRSRQLADGSNRVLPLFEAGKHQTVLAESGHSKGAAPAACPFRSCRIAASLPCSTQPAR